MSLGFFLVFFVAILFLFLVFVVCFVSDTEQQLTPAHDILFWGSGHPDGSIYLSCASAFDFLTLPAGASFLFFGALTWLLVVMA